MKKLVFLSTFAFDANISLIDSLREFWDVYFITEALYKVENYLDNKNLTKLITNGNEVEEINRFSSLIDLDKTYVVKGVRQNRIFTKLSNSKKINDFVEQINPDVILIDSHLLTYIFTAIKYRKKTLLIVHDPFFHSGENSLTEKLLRKFFFSFTKNKLLLNENQKQSFIEFYKQDHKNIYTSFLSTYRYLTVYADHQDVNDVDKSKFNVLFFGRISEYKGLQYLLEACKEIIESKEHTDLTFTIAGSGSFSFDIEKYKNYEQLEIINNFIPPEKLVSLITKSAVVICPYIDATQSGVVMTCFAFKKPVIATNVGGLPEMVTHEETGLIIDPKSSAEIAAAILRLKKDTPLLQQMSKNIEKIYIVGEKSWKTSASLFSSALESVYFKSIVDD